MQEQALSFPLWFGLDVSKKTFTAAGRSIIPVEPTFRPPEKAYEISAKGVREFLKWAGRESRGRCCDGNFAIAMEATGIYSNRLADLIQGADAGRHVAICNPLNISLYARSFSEEKSDKADASVIARYACERQPGKVREKTDAEKRLRELVRTREAMTEQIVAAKSLMESIKDKDVRRCQGVAIHALEKVRKTLEKRIAELVDENPEIKEELELMQTAPGVGLLSAATIYSELGSLKQYTRKQLSALSGVCPVNKQSGTSVNRHGMSKRGSRRLRHILYLDSHQAIRKIPALAAFHDRLLARPNSSKMSAKCACMRKLLLILHGMVVSGKAFDPNYHSEKIVRNPPAEA